MIPARTSPVPAVARRWSPAVTTRTSPSGLATIVVGPFSTTTLRVSARQSTGRHDAVGVGPGAREQAELAVVGREHRWRVASTQPTGTAGLVPGNGEQCVTVDDDRAARSR